jgi:hypothetical protein
MLERIANSNVKTKFWRIVDRTAARLDQATGGHMERMSYGQVVPVAGEFRPPVTPRPDSSAALPTTSEMVRYAPRRSRSVGTGGRERAEIPERSAPKEVLGLPSKARTSLLLASYAAGIITAFTSLGAMLIGPLHPLFYAVGPVVHLLMRLIRRGGNKEVKTDQPARTMIMDKTADGKMTKGQKTALKAGYVSASAAFVVGIVLTFISSPWFLIGALLPMAIVAGTHLVGRKVIAEQLEAQRAEAKAQAERPLHQKIAEAGWEELVQLTKKLLDDLDTGDTTKAPLPPPTDKINLTRLSHAVEERQLQLAELERGDKDSITDIHREAYRNLNDLLDVIKGRL